MMFYEPKNWFWTVGGDESRAWSSASGAYVAEWPSDRMTRILNEQELGDVLRQYGLRGPVAAAVDVDAERDRRVALMAFNGKTYDCDKTSLRRIDTAKTNALAAIINGAQLADLRWADPNIDFAWIAHDNSATPMDAQTCLAFGMAAASWEGRHIVAARALKNMNPIPADYATNAAYWPQD